MTNHYFRLILIFTLLAGIVSSVRVMSHPGDDDHSHSDQQSQTSVALPNPPQTSISAESTLRSYLEDISQKSATRIVAGVSSEKLDAQIKASSTTGTVFELLNGLNDRAGIYYQVLADAIVVKQQRRFTGNETGSARANLITQFALSLTTEQLGKINHTEAALAPSLTLEEVTPQQLEVAQKILKSYGPTFEGTSSSSFPPEAILLRIRFELLAKISVKDKEFILVPEGQVTDSQVAQQLQLAYNARNGGNMVALPKVEGSIASFIPFVVPLHNTNEIIFDKAIKDTNVFFTFTKVSKESLRQYVSSATGAQVRDLGDTIFVAAPKRDFADSLWSFGDKLRNIKATDRVDPFFDLRGETTPKPIAMLSQHQQALLIQRFDDYRAVNPSWQAITDADVINRGTVEVAGNLEVGFTLQPSNGNAEMRRLVGSPTITTHYVTTVQN